MKKILNVVFLGLTLSLVSCGHFGGKSCHGEHKAGQCKTDKSCCKGGQCEMKKKS